jgi:hypothetical protein
MVRKYFFQTLMLLLATAIWIGCNKDDDDEGARYTISGNGSGNQEVPVVSTSGTCTVTGTYIAKDKELRYSISFNGLTSNAVNMHFHGPADPGVAAGVLVPVTGFPQATSGNFSGTASLTTTAEQESALLAGKMYLNIHSVNFPDGEVRAQIGVQRVD